MSRDCKNENATLELLLKIQKLDIPLEANRIGESILLGTDSVKEIIEALEFKKSFHPADVWEALEAIKWIYTTLLGIKFEGQITNETYSIWVLTALIPIENALYQAEAQSRELAEVKKKIKRYIELNNKSITLDCEYDEFERLEKELSSDE